MRCPNIKLFCSFLSRPTGQYSSALTAYYTLSGTAQPGADYSPQSDFGTVYSISIPGGGSSASAQVQVNALADDLWEGDEHLTLSLRSNSSYWLSSARTASGTIEDVAVNLAVDSNNNGVIGQSDEAIEDDADKPGKIVAVNDDDDDKDGVPDFADFDGIAGEDFVPLTLEIGTGINFSNAKIKFDYSASDPKDIIVQTEGSSTTYAPATAGMLRIWKKQGSSVRDGMDIKNGGDYITPDEQYTLAELGINESTRRATLYVEAAKFDTAMGNQHIIINLDPDGNGPAGADVQDDLRVTPLDLDLNFNLNRGSGPDQYSDTAAFDKPYQFWLNDDHDSSGDSSGSDEQVDANHPRDSLNARITNLRDLEDFSSFQILETLQWMTNLGPEYQLKLKFTDITSGKPAIKVYQVNNLGSNYLYYKSTADSVMNFANSHYLGLIDSENAVEIPISAFDQRVLSQFIFEGVEAGQAVLTIQLARNNHVIADAEGYLDLRPITQLYDHFTVGDTINMDPAAIPPFAAKIRTAVDSPQLADNPDYILFVHGWRMQPWERRSFAETAYKRLFWEGYNGKFGLFSWPTEWNPGSYWSAATDPQNYDRSEQKAYLSGWGLHGVLTQLNQEYPGKVDVFGHSMGNIVISEALRIEATSEIPQHIVNTYVASQASSVANAYDAAVPTTEDDNSTNTPEVYASYPPTGNPYYEKIGLAADKLVNYYNPQDYALSDYIWMANQDTKSDVGWYYKKDTSRWYRDDGQDDTELFFPQDRFEIFAHIAEARSLPLGRQSNVGGPFNTAAQINLDVAFDFGGGSNTSHSAQFLATKMDRWGYWRQLLQSFGTTT